MLKVFMDAFPILAGLAPLINHILRDSLSEVPIWAVLVQFDG